MPVPKQTFKNSNVPKSANLPKGKIVKIELTEEQKQEIKYILNGDPPKKVRDRYEKNGITDISLMRYHSTSKRSRFEAVRKIVGGLCCRCDRFNTHLHKQKISGAVVITRYCTEHVPDKIKKFNC